ncbi:hypothetical protein KGQ71_00470 [Patescibacteria group bacterium]|nr:hypothetical protein [Patescibacteria group bacterium]
MARSFLGKPIPRSSSHRPLPRPGHFSLTLYIIAPLVLTIGYCFMFSHHLFVPTSPTADAITLPTARVLGAASAPNPNAALTNQYAQNTGGAATQTLSCNVKNLFAGADAPDKQIFPLIPASISSGGSICPPQAWNIGIVYFFAVKALILANWLAVALAIILTVYAGLLYISGFANEKNVQTAKTWLISVYTGLLIVILARIIVYGIDTQLLGVTSNPSTPPGGGNLSVPAAK